MTPEPTVTSHPYRGRAAAIPLAAITHTADIIRPTDDDTNPYGEATEEGYGYELESGYIDPGHSLRHTDDEPTTYYVDLDDLADQYAAELDDLDDASLPDLDDVLAGCIERRLNDVTAIDAVQHNGDSLDITGADFHVVDYATSESVRVSARVEAPPRTLDKLADRITPTWQRRHHNHHQEENPR